MDIDMDELPIPPSSLTAPNHPGCGVCGQPATSCCKRCYNMWYCSSGCLSDDRPLHQGLCKSFATLERHPTSGDSRRYSRAIYFPVLEDSPSFIWLEHHQEYSIIETTVSRIESLIGGKYESWMNFDCHREQRRLLGYKIEILCGAHFACDGPNINRSIQNLLYKIGVQWKLADRWAGPFIARGTTPGGTPIHLDTSALTPILS